MVKKIIINRIPREEPSVDLVCVGTPDKSDFSSSNSAFYFYAQKDEDVEIVIDGITFSMNAIRDKYQDKYKTEELTKDTFEVVQRFQPAKDFL